MSTDSFTDEQLDAFYNNAVSRAGIANLRRGHEESETDYLSRLQRSLTRAFIATLQEDGAVQSAATSAPAASEAEDERIYGTGAKEFSVLVTLDTTAYRHIRIRADDEKTAGEVAANVAVGEQGAYFTLNEGNHVRRSDVSVTSVDEVEMSALLPAAEVDIAQRARISAVC